VLDDLPSMDNAEVRRGKPCVHRVFPAWATDMAPVFLLTMAYQISLDNPRASEERRVRAALVLSAAGLDMISGQVRDMKQEHESDEQALLQCYLLKSGSLYAAAAKAGAILCGASDDDAQRVHVAGLNLGMSYQMLDDVADVVAGVNEVGKKSGMDARKWTAINWLGVEGARQKSLEFQSLGLAALQPFGCDADWLRTLVCEASWKPH
jgi:geranylgeranyl pyrophosphate synthase